MNLKSDVALIYRNYHSKIDKKKLLELREFCKVNKRKLYLSNNIKLAVNLDLDGAYIPSFNKNLGIHKFNKKKDFLILGSAHNVFEIRIKEKQNVDLLFLSPIFKSKKNKNYLEIIKFNILARQSTKKIIALGGINKRNINKLKIANTYGFSGISYFFQ